VALFTLCFLDKKALATHHQRHRGEFGWISEEKYAYQADKFLGSPLNVKTQFEGKRSNGDIVRYDRVTDEFGILSSDRHVLTYFKPDVRTHGRASNLEYFQRECSK
jgi:pyocin large subunit-like protein